MTIQEAFLVSMSSAAMPCVPLVESGIATAAASGVDVDVDAALPSLLSVLLAKQNAADMTALEGAVLAHIDMAVTAGAARTAPATFYVDPLSGSPTNDGLTRETAWQTLADVLKTRTFVSGDVIYLARGYHGAPVVTRDVSGPVGASADPSPASGSGSGSIPTAALAAAFNDVDMCLEGLDADVSTARAATAKLVASTKAADATAALVAVADALHDAGATTAALQRLAEATTAVQTAIAAAEAGGPVPSVVTPGVLIAALPGHTPLFRSLVFTDGAKMWTVRGPICITRTATPMGSPDAVASTTTGVSVDATCSDITLQYLSAYTMQSTVAWTARTWAANKLPFYFNAPRVTVVNCHTYNGGMLQLDFGAAGFVGTGIVIENFASDGCNMKGTAPVLTGSAIYGSRKVDGNHNDLVQVWSRNGGVVVGNVFAAYVDPAQAYLAAPGVSDCQGFGGYDGAKVGWIIANNIVRVDHPIGIWFLGGKDCVVANNTVVRCGKATYFKGAPTATSMRRPCILMAGPKPLDPATGLPIKAGAGGTVVVNNVAEQYYVPDATVLNTGNVTIDGTKLTSYFAAPVAPNMDFHPKAGALQTAGMVTAHQPARGMVDFDGAPLPPVGSRCTAGALQYNAAHRPFVSEFRTVTSVTQTPQGVDVSWTPVAGDKAFAVLRNGVRVGLQRTGAASWFVVEGTTGAGVTFTVKTLPMVSL